MKRKIRVIVDDEELDSSLNFDFINSGKLEEVLEREKKKRKLQKEKDVDIVMSGLVAFIKKYHVSLSISGGLHELKSEYCNCPRNEQCNEYEHELEVNINGYSENSEYIYRYSIVLYQVIDLVDDKVYFSEAQIKSIEFEWKSNIKIYEYPNIIKIITTHINNIEDVLTNEDDFFYAINPFLDEIRKEILLNCKNNKNIKNEKITCNWNEKNCDICKLGEKFNYLATDFITI